MGKNQLILTKPRLSVLTIIEEGTFPRIANQLGIQGTRVEMLGMQDIYEQKIRVLEYDVKDKSNLLKYTQKQLDEALRENEDLIAKLEKFETYFKNLTKLLNSQISAKVKTGLGYDSQFNEKEVLNVNEEEVIETVFDNRSSDEENIFAENQTDKNAGPQDTNGNAENQTDKNAGPQDTNGNAGIQDNVNARKEVSDQQYIVLPLWSFISSTYKSSDDKAKDDKPKDSTDSKTGVKPVNKEDQAYEDELDRLISQEKEASDAADALRKEFKQGCMDQRGATKAGITNSFNIDTAELRSTSLFTSAYDDDLDIFTSSVQSVGAEADFNNMESSTVVSPIPTHRVHIDHPKDQILGDPKSALQTRGMANKSFGAHDFVEPKKVAQSLDDESWVEAMQEENKKDERGTVVRNKARLVAQGHRQEERINYDEIFAPVARIEAITIFLAFASYMGFIVYQMDVKSALLYGTIEEEVYVKQSKEGIFITQDKYVAEILKKFDFSSVKTASTPIKTQKPLVRDEEAVDVDVHLYRSMIGSLMYLIASRPDIMFAVYACSRFQVTPKLSHLHAVKQIFRDSYEKKLIQVLKIHTDDNVADLLTKAFDVSRLNFLKANIGMLNL
nr:hypothetical protein [Tanacetum cinerariifolium]